MKSLIKKNLKYWSNLRKHWRVFCTLDGPWCVVFKMNAVEANLELKLCCSFTLSTSRPPASPPHLYSLNTYQARFHNPRPTLPHSPHRSTAAIHFRSTSPHISSKCYIHGFFFLSLTPSSSSLLAPSWPYPHGPSLFLFFFSPHLVFLNLLAVTNW